MLTRRGFAAALGAAALVRPGRAQGNPFEDWDRLSSMLDAMRVAWRAPGFAFAIVRGGEAVYAEGFGTLTQEGPERVTPDTLFGCASTTKAFTAAGAAALVAGGKLDWDAPVREVLPAFGVKGGPEYASISLRDMLSHRTGLPRHDLLWYNDVSLTREGLLKRLPYLEVSKPLRAEFQYNNIMYMIAGHAVETAAAEPWEVFTARRILSPLGMDRTVFAPDDAKAKGNTALGHFLNDARIAETAELKLEDRIGPAGCLFSSANDYAKWVRLQLGYGTAVGLAGLYGASEARAMWAPTIATGGQPEFDDYTDGFYGLGWRIDTYRGRRRIQHGGNLNGYASRVTLYPDEALGFVAFANLSSSPLPGHATQDVTDLMLGLEPRNWSAMMIERRDKAEAASKGAEAKKSLMQVPGTAPSRALALFTGPYADEGYGPMTVQEADGALRAVYNGMPMRLAHWHYDVFNAEAERLIDSDLNDLKFSFRSDTLGRIAELEVNMEPLVSPIVFKRQPTAEMRSQAWLDRFRGTYADPDRPDDQARSVTFGIVGDRLAYSDRSVSLLPLEPDFDGSFFMPGEPDSRIRFVSEGGSVTAVQYWRPDGVYEGKLRQDAAPGAPAEGPPL